MITITRMGSSWVTKWINNHLFQKMMKKPSFFMNNFWNFTIQKHSWQLFRSGTIVWVGYFQVYSLNYYKKTFFPFLICFKHLKNNNNAQQRLQISKKNYSASMKKTNCQFVGQQCTRTEGHHKCRLEMNFRPLFLQKKQKSCIGMSMNVPVQSEKKWFVTHFTCQKSCKCCQTEIAIILAFSVVLGSEESRI